MYAQNMFVTISVLMAFYSLGSFAQISKAIQPVVDEEERKPLSTISDNLAVLPPTELAIPVVRVCLQNGKIERFNNNTHACIINRIDERKSHSLTLNLKASPLASSLANTLSVTQVAEKQSAADNENSDILKCGSSRKARKSRGYKCCGYQPYHPDFETCCKDIVYPYKVHTGKNHKDHVCCGINVYRRNTTIPCQHPARNDKLWKSNKRFTKEYKARTNCPGKQHEYLVRVGAKDEQHNFLSCNNY